MSQTVSNERAKPTAATSTPPPHGRPSQSGANRRAARRRRGLIYSGVASVVVVAVIAAFVVVKANGSANATSGPAPAYVANPVPDGVLAALAAIPATSLAQASTAAKVAAPKPITAPALTSGGKPQVFYLGAEYCPFCAAQNWALVTALSHFGTFTTLGTTQSGSKDVYPNTHTFTFHGATYTSDYLSFLGIETATNQAQGTGYVPLDRLTDPESYLVRTYNAVPFVPAASAGAIPIIDLGGHAVISGASFSPGVLAGLSFNTIAAAVPDATSTVGANVQAVAGMLTAQLCLLTGGRPAAVCSAFPASGSGA